MPVDVAEEYAGIPGELKRLFFGRLVRVGSQKRALDIHNFLSQLLLDGKGMVE